MNDRPGVPGAGTEDRAWVRQSGTSDDCAGRRQYRVEVTEHVGVTMSDGITLSGRLFLPQADEGAKRWPCLLLANGYGNRNQPREDELCGFFARSGYAVLHVSMRGSGASEGVNTLFESYGEDGCELVAWMAGQEWSTGAVGMIGQSLRGISQWLTAKRLPPGLKAISPEIASPDGYDDLWYAGGTLPGPGRRSRGAPEYPAAAAHRNKDEWWRERTVSPEELARIAQSGIAALISGGWQDYVSPGNLKAYSALRAYGGICKLVVGPEAHASVARMEPYDFRLCQLRWFDRYLKGEDNGIDREEPVLLFIRGADMWRYERDWPIPDAKRAAFYLAGIPSGTLAGRDGDGSLSFAPESESGSSVSCYDYLPDTGPLLPAMRCARGGIPAADLSRYEEATASWTTEPLPRPAEITGIVRLRLWAACTAEDADFVVTLSAVSPGGRSQQLTCGYLNASRSRSRSHPAPLVPGEIRDYIIELMPIASVVPESYRLRLAIAGGSCSLPEQEAPQGPGLQPLPSAVTIYHSGRYPSCLEVPVIGSFIGPE
ncbi:CocE/NonD family hydrolase [Paenibacillus doosanensis]|uniref:CocE/NonD family hydrolase n=1 Tax=Paenibacillus doosanensis TaxID=1229154 RepID=UPI00217F3123|nr:CocE/NonD family hydrolase [Paenibacillus doosanensis]MCS7460974.1 CocE/NonD family hydrolase [Paenibacillus doosanensis]